MLPCMQGRKETTMVPDCNCNTCCIVRMYGRNRRTIKELEEENQKLRYRLDAMDRPGSTGRALLEVCDERARQEQLKKEGRFKYTCADKVSNFQRLAVLIEEIGEAARAMLEAGELVSDSHNTDLRKEMAQIAAVSVAWLEGLEKDQ